MNSKFTQLYYKEETGPFQWLYTANLALGSFISLGYMILTFILAPIGSVVSYIAALAILMLGFLIFLPLALHVPRPRNRLPMAFLWGSLVAGGYALLVNTTAAELIGENFSAVVTAPIGEEIFKGSLLLLIFFFHRHLISNPLDGLALGAVIGLGFAFTENIGYLTNAFMTDGAGMVIAIFIARAGSFFLHPLFTAILGLSIGLAASSRYATAAKSSLILIGLLIAMFLHWGWNYTATYPTGELTLLLVYSSYILITLSLVTYAKVARISELIRYQEALQELVATERLTPIEAFWLKDSKARKFIQLYAKTLPLPQQRMLLMHQAATHCFVHDHMLYRLHGPTQSTIERGSYYLQQYHSLRPFVTFPLPYHQLT